MVTIEYVLGTDSFVQLSIFDVAGKLVRTLVDTEGLPAGRYTAGWDGRDNDGSRVSSGMYFYKLEAEGFVQTRKMVVLK